MSIMQALSDVGYKPTKGELTRLTEFKRAFKGVLEPFIKPRKIQFEKAGSHVRARYQGQRTFVMGHDKHEATSRLKTWVGK